MDDFTRKFRIPLDKDAEIHQTLSTVYKSLEEKGYVTRIQDPQDKRQNRVYPTESAKEIAPMVRKELYKINLALTKSFTEEESQQIYDLLARMEETFEF